MPSEAAVKLATQVISTGAGVMGTSYNSGMVQFLASQLDAVVALMDEMKGTPSPERVALVLARKGLGLTNLADNYAINCGGSLLTLGFGVALAGGEGVSGVGLPAALIQAASILADGYSAFNSCVVPAIEPAKTWYVQIVMDFCREMGVPYSMCY
jgi:hypothetical protein